MTRSFIHSPCLGWVGDVATEETESGEDQRAIRVSLQQLPQLGRWIARLWVNMHTHNIAQSKGVRTALLYTCVCVCVCVCVCYLSSPEGKGKENSSEMKQVVVVALVHL